MVSENGPETGYRHEGELEPVRQAEFFNTDGSLTDIGAQEFARKNTELERLATQCGITRDQGRVIADFLIWRENQWRGLQRPRLGQV